MERPAFRWPDSDQQHQFAQVVQNRWAAMVGDSSDLRSKLELLGGRSVQVTSPGDGREDFPGSPGPDSYLTGVRAVSAKDAWAVGYYNRGPSGASRSLILHWNGTRCAQVPSPAPGAGNKLDAVTPVSATSAWAVGSSRSQQPGSPFILHWNGTAWTQAASPNPGAGGNLSDIAASSPTSTWAVGQFGAVGGDHAFTVRYCPPAADKSASAGGDA
ncbi:MAG: hypothetical protein ACRDNW_24845 [Trebonia sp.]